ncbi:unnamed protein product [Calypogeia fissa]
MLKPRDAAGMAESGREGREREGKGKGQGDDAKGHQGQGLARQELCWAPAGERREFVWWGQPEGYWPMACPSPSPDYQTLSLPTRRSLDPTLSFSPVSSSFFACPARIS